MYTYPRQNSSSHSVQYIKKDDVEWYSVEIVIGIVKERVCEVECDKWFSSKVPKSEERNTYGEGKLESNGESGVISKED